MSAPGRPALLADVGGTSARFAILDADGSPKELVTLESRKFEDLFAPVEHALSIYGKSLGQPPAAADGAFSIHGESVERPIAAAVAVAGPVTGDLVELTNVGWRFSIEESRRALGLERLVVINDLAAVAHALPDLGGGRTELLLEGGGGSAPTEVRAVVGVGTGLGVATAVRAPAGGEVVLAGEGGHRDLAASTAREWAVVDWLSGRFGGHVSAERALSGPGLAAIYAVLGELGEVGRAGGEAAGPEEVVARARGGESRAAEALALFAGWLGAFAGDLALTVGARGGLWIAGGLVPALGEAFDRRAFAGRFLGKGRFRGWLEAVPVRLVVEPHAAMWGLARALRAPG